MSGDDGSPTMSTGNTMTKILRFFLGVVFAASIPVLILEFHYTSDYTDNYQGGPRQKLVAKRQRWTEYDTLAGNHDNDDALWNEWVSNRDNGDDAPWEVLPRNGLSNKRDTPSMFGNQGELEDTPLNQAGMDGYIRSNIGNGGRTLSNHDIGERALDYHDIDQRALSNHNTNAGALDNNDERAVINHGNGGRALNNYDNGRGILGALLGGSSRCIKTIHIFAEREYFDIPEELQQFSFIFDHDPKVECAPLGQYDCELQFSISAQFSEIKGKDAVVFGMNGAQWTPSRNYKLLEPLVQMEPEPGQTWIYYSIEPPFRMIRWSESLKIARLHYHVLMSYNREADVQLPFGYFRQFTNNADGGANSVVRTAGDAAYLDAVRRNRTGLISWVSSNCDDVLWPRVQFVLRLRGLLPLDTYGKCGHLECLPKRSERCKNLLSSYKFYLALPNSECNDYITEKFWVYALGKGSVPVVYGARKADYEAIAPPNSYIHVADFDDLQHLADFLLMLDRNDHLYAKFHEWRKYGDVRGMFPTPSLFCSAVPLIKPRAPSELKILGESPWYTGCREIPSASHVYTRKNRMSTWSVWR